MNPFLTPVREVRPWHERARCATDPELFFDNQRVDEALAICWGCPVRSPCDEAAQALGETNGIWGGSVRHRSRSAS